MSAPHRAGVLVIGPDDVVTVLVTEDGTPHSTARREYVIGLRSREWAEAHGVEVTTG